MTLNPKWTRAMSVWVAILGIGVGSARAQELSVSDRISREEAMLALAEGSYAEALQLLDDVIGSAGPSAALLHDAAWAAFEAGEFERAQGYIEAVLETDEAEYRSSEDYDDAFRLAARIQRSLRPILIDRIDASPLPFSDSLARSGFGREIRDGSCQWRFDDGGLVGESKKNATCMNGTAATADRVRITLMIEKNGGGSKSAAGLVFGYEDADNYLFLRLHPKWDDAGGDVSVVGVVDGVQTLRMTSMAPDERGRPLRSWNDEGPWRLSVEVRGRRIDWFLGGRWLGTTYLDREVRGAVMAASSGADDGEFLFTNLSIERLDGNPAPDLAARQ